MNKLVTSLASITAAGTMLAACQSESYKIEGKTDLLQDGDTLFLITDFIKEMPIETTIVKDGRFYFEGQADSTCLCRIYDSKRNDIIAPFFIEPGTIKLNISAHERKITSSPSINKKWLAFQDSAVNIGRQINMIAAYVHSNNLSTEEQKEQMLKYENLANRFKNIVLKYAKDNIDNEFGYFLLTYYDSMTNGAFIDADTKLSLIKKMPHNMQERQTIKNITARLNRMKAFDEGGKINDFEMNDINGKPISIMQEISKNKITIIDFWASWCGPCLNEMPNIISMYKQHKEDGLGIFGISLDSRQNEWENATKRFGIEWPQVSDLKGWNNAAARMFNVQSIPMTIVVDNKGTILKKGLRGTELKAYIESELK